MLGDVLRQIDRIVSYSVALPALNMLNVIAFTHMTHNVIDFVSVRRVSEYFCDSFSFIFVDFSTSAASWLVCRILVVALCRLFQWCQCRSVDRNGISDYIFIDPNSFGWNFKYLQCSCLTVHRLEVRFSRQGLCSRGSH